MRFKSLVLSSTSFAILAVSATPAAAQGQAAPPDPTVQAQESPADPEAGSPQTDDPVQSTTGADDAAGDEIVVTGIRRSLQSAQGLKRNSEQIVDTVVAEDIGKLPDLAVSDTAARIPGVQVVRTGGEASAVLVRGLPDFTTTYNGREIFTAETRVVALQDFPSANIAALEVFKTTSANLVEAGLAGLVNVRSRRPFDFKGLEIAGSAWGLYTKQAGEWTPNGNILISNRWETGMGDIGVLLNASYTQLKFLDSEPSNTDFLQTFTQEGDRLICCGPPVDARFPDIQRLFYRSGDRTRPSVNAAVQWRNGDFELYAEGLYQGFRNKIDDRRVDVPLYGGASYSNLVFRTGTNQLQSGTVTGLGDPIFTLQGGTYNKTDTYQFAVGGSYDSGPLRITADLARTDSRFTGSTESVDRIFTGQATTEVDFDLTTPQFTIRNFDITNPNNYLFDGLFEQDQVSEGDDYQARLDAEYELGSDFIRSIQAGVRWTDRGATREFGERFAGFRGQNIPASSLPLDFELARRGFRGTDVQSGFETWLTPTYESIRENRVELRQFVRNLGRADYTDEPVAPNPTSSYEASEETLAGYAQLNFGFGDTVDGIVGIRAVRTETEISGTSNVEGVLTPVSLTNEYTDWLPNASVRVRLTPEVQLRASFTQTRTRPFFSQLNPSATLGPPETISGGGTIRRGSGGNPFLRPFTSDNYDLSLEYYFSRTGFASLALFRRDIDGFIQNQTFQYEDPNLGLIEVTAPVNTRRGRIEGLEAQVTTFFEFDGAPDWLRNFGIQANYTYLDAKAELFNPTTGDFEFGRIIIPGPPVGPGGGISKHTYNIVGLFERGPASARLTYNKRSHYLDRRDIRGDEEGGFYQEEAFPAGRLDLSLNYTVIENATLFFDWTNITGDPFEVRFSSARAGQPRAEYVRYQRYDESTMSLGVRFRL